ncbi:MAG TPA: phosphoribosylaminoimidazolesuccinocarboxamide synthase [Acidobacteriaceae bacterium]|nr:phosphoribosylaminoimidazolesuccinocarboxamide synthase [Acidobacteriaceae bacterium]
MKALLETDFRNLTLVARGKVRDIYSVGEALLMVATDRISAFDHVLATGIPGKGKILTQLSLFWFDLLKAIVPNHLIASNVKEFPEEVFKYRRELKDRSMLVTRAQMYPVECVVRGYLSGSGWKDYVATGMVCGIKIEPGLREGDRLSRPIFTPATKSFRGTHDENISFDQMATLMGGEPAERLREISLGLYNRAAEHAEKRGLLLADTKFEFGTTGQGMVLADEVLTPDSSRFWLREQYSPGRSQMSFDKQYVRDYLESIHWNKLAPAPALPENVVNRTQQKYLEAYRLLTGRPLAV